MLGADQRQWLADGIDGSSAVWDVIGNQTVFVPLPFGPAYNNDQWDGYPQDRDRVWDILKARPNPLVVTGDIHAAGVARMHATLDDPDSERIGTELVGTSVSSSFDPGLVDAGRGAGERHPLHRVRQRPERGYTVVDLTAEGMRAEYKVVSDATVPDGTISSAFVYERRARTVADGPVDEEPPPATGDPGTAPPATPISGAARFTG